METRLESSQTWSQRLPFTTLAKELRSAHFIDGFIGMLQKVDLVVLNAIDERPPHIHASRLDALPLVLSQLGSEELIEGFLFAILAEPQGLAGLQVVTTVMNFMCLPKQSLLNGAFPGNCGTFSIFTPHSEQHSRYSSTDHRVLILPLRQVAHLALVIIMGLGKLPSTSRTDQFALAPSPPHRKTR
jgi:hypothetical protein